MNVPVITERTIHVDGIDLHVAEVGVDGGPGLVLLHGLYDRWSVWKPAMVALADRFRLIAPDLRGHGQSSKLRDDYAIGDYASDIVRLLDATGHASVAVTGHSLGALVAIRMAGHWPERVRALILIDPPLEQSDAAREWLAALLDAKRGSESETYAALQDMLWHLDEAEWRRQTEWLRGTADGPFEALLDPAATGDHFDALGAVTAPTLVLQADPSAGAACSDGAARRALACLANGRLTRFLDTGHSIHRERPDEVAAAIASFLSEV